MNVPLVAFVGFVMKLTAIITYLLFLVPSVVLAHGGFVDEHTYTTTSDGRTEIIVASVVSAVVIAAIIFFIKRKKL